MKEMLGVREVLQSLEEKLIEDGWDEITVRTDHGLFMWRIHQRRRRNERCRR